MKVRSKSQSNRLFGLLSKLDLASDESRAELAMQYSNGRTAKTSELGFMECAQLITDLQKQVDSGIAATAEAANRMRRRIIAMAHDLGWELPGGKADMYRINNWCTVKGYLHKPLNEYKYEELPHLVTAFQEMHKDILKKAGSNAKC